MHAYKVTLIFCIIMLSSAAGQLSLIVSECDMNYESSCCVHDREVDINTVIAFCLCQSNTTPYFTL